MKVVKILTRNNFAFNAQKGSGEKVQNPVWCLTITEAATSRTFCEGEAFGIGDSNCDYETSTTGKTKITCKKCIAKIKEIQKIKV